jgi:glyoxylase-like metal-dependent hydrolase (beta-lactamase superfamily II)
VIRPAGALGFVPDFLMGDDPDSVKAGLLESLEGLLDLPFDSLLPAHGDPLVGGGKQALRDFVEGRKSRA